MNTTKKITIALFAVLTIIAVSCKKDKNKTELLTKAPWKQTNVILPDGTDYTDDCHRDNIYTFKTDGTASVDVGTNICDEGTSTEEEDLTINWLFNSDETFFTIDGEVNEVVTLDGNNLTLKNAFGTTKFKH